MSTGNGFGMKERYEVGTEPHLVTSDRYPSGETVRITWRPEVGTPQFAYYALEEHSTNREARGLCLKGKRTKRIGVLQMKDGTEIEESAMVDRDHLPEEIIARFPDLAGLLDDPQLVGRYLKGFNEELKTELKVLKSLENLEGLVASPLPGEDLPPTLNFKYGLFEGPAQVLLCRPVNVNPGNRRITLREWRNDHENGLALEKWFAFTHSLTKALHKLHLAGAPYGYLSPDNIIVTDGDSPGDPELINLEWDTPDPSLHLTKDVKAFDRAMLCWRRRYDSPDKVSYYRGTSDTHDIYDPFVPGDIFSLGLTLLYLASAPSEVEETLQPFHKEEPWGSRPWNLITEPILKSNEQIKKDILKRLKRGSGISEESGMHGELYRQVIAATEVIFVVSPASIRPQDYGSGGGALSGSIVPLCPSVVGRLCRHPLYGR